jgi:hypothetical protein
MFHHIFPHDGHETAPWMHTRLPGINKKPCQLCISSIDLAAVDDDLRQMIPLAIYLDSQSFLSYADHSYVRMTDKSDLYPLWLDLNSGRIQYWQTVTVKMNSSAAVEFLARWNMTVFVKHVDQKDIIHHDK